MLVAYIIIALVVIGVVLDMGIRDEMREHNQDDTLNF